MKVELLHISENAEKLIESAGRTCYKSNDRITEESSGKFIKGIIKSGHESVLEHASATFRISGISRACSHQLVRHRIASLSQQSQRYVKESQFKYIVPEGIINTEFENIYHATMLDIQNAYTFFIEQGVKPENARFLLPNACCTEIVVTMNFRSLRNFFKLRLEKHAQWEIREMAEYMLDQIIVECPNVFCDIVEEFL